MEVQLKNQPETKFVASPVTATVWVNRNDVNGKPVEFRTITLARTYKDSEGNWKNTNSFRVNDLPKAQLALAKAYEFLVLKGGTQ